MTPAQDEQIERGRALNRLQSYPEYQEFKKILAEEISEIKEARSSFDGRINSNGLVLVGLQHELRALERLENRIADEIEEGARLLRRKNDLAATSKGPAGSEETDPVGAIGGNNR